jgi:surfeit locus 1 family protein|tara:strand:+ start:2157 stop:2810 length:654 start_codon:yes stop_codon:yes gene_type:complete
LKHKFLFSIFVFFFIANFIALGTWQIVRLNWKLELIKQIEISLKDKPVNLSNHNHKNYLKIKTFGIFNFDKQIYLYTLNEKGEPGFDVVTPVIIDNKNYLLNRGWISFNKKNTKEINILNSNDIIGTLKKQIKANRFKPLNNIDENYWFTLNRKDIFEYTGKNFSPYIIYLNNNLDTPKTKTITTNVSNNHKKYAITWFSLALSVFIFYLYFRKKKY